MSDPRALINSATLDDTEYCRRCGAVLDFADCGICDDGYTHPGQLYEEDPLQYDEDDTKPCYQCGGDGGWWICPNRQCSGKAP